MSTPDDIAGYQDVATGSRDAPAAEPGAAQVSAVSSPELKSLLGVVVGTLVIAALYFGKEVLVPITLAVILSFVLSPVVNFLQRLRLWRAPAVIVTVLSALALLGLVGTLIGSQAASLTSDAPQYAQTIEAKVAAFRASPSPSSPRSPSSSAAAAPPAPRLAPPPRRCRCPSHRPAVAGRCRSNSSRGRPHPSPSRAPCWSRSCRRWRRRSSS